MTYEKLYLYGKNIDNLTLYEYNNNYDEYTISFSYVITPVKSQKKILMTLEMVQKIVPKLINDSYNNCIKGLFTGLPPIVSANNNRFYLVKSQSSSTAVIENDDTTLQIYSPVNFGSFGEEPHISNFRGKLANLQNKPRTLLTHDSLNTYLNILIAMLDKPHDILTDRVPEEVQQFMMTIISTNIEKYINYLDEIVSTNLITTINGAGATTFDINNKKDKFKNLIKFVRLMMPKFKNYNPSKNVNTHVLYENAIMLLVKDILTEVQPLVNPSFVVDLNAKFQTPPSGGMDVIGNDNVVINPDVMYLTTDITSRVNQNQTGTNKIRKYFSAPEVIDHGHIYNIDQNTNIQFPENYKEIQLRDHINITNYVTIHSYSETTQVDSDNILHYNVYVWFTVNEDPVPKCIIKYKTPFLHAPDCARVYAGYKNFILNNIFNIFVPIVNANFTTLSDSMRHLIPYLMLDQFYNAKSLQDDQNQLQVNQRTTIPPSIPPPIPPDNIPTQFLGLCCDLTSAANGFNYYMSKEAAVRNQNSIVGYYHSNKKIWVTDRNEIKIQIINAPAKLASIDIFTILLQWINGATPIVAHGGAPPQPTSYLENKGGEKRKFTGEEGSMDESSDTDEDPNTRKRKITISKQNKAEANKITLDYYCDQKEWEYDYTKTEEYGQYVYYNTMADQLYLDGNFEKYKDHLLTKVRYYIEGQGQGIPCISSNCMFDIFSIDFVDKTIAMLNNSKHLIVKMIKKNDDKILEKIIGQCAIYILTKIELKPDNIYPPNEQIKMSNKLDEQYNQVKSDINSFINNYKNVAEVEDEAGLDPKSSASDEEVSDEEGYTSVEDFSQDSQYGGGFPKKRTFRKRTNKKRTIINKTNKKRTIRHTIFKTNKKKTIRKKTNNKRTIRKKTNKKRTIRKKIRDTMLKTKKNHK